MIVFELKRTEGSFNGIIAYMANFVKGFWAKKCEVALLGTTSAQPATKFRSLHETIFVKGKVRIFTICLQSIAQITHHLKKAKGSNSQVKSLWQNYDLTI